MVKRIFGGNRRIGLDPETVKMFSQTPGLQDTTKVRALSDALVEGAQAFIDGKKIDDNPYNHETQRAEWSDWKFAYTECKLKEFMDRHGLGPEDMENDITYPSGD